MMGLARLQPTNKLCMHGDPEFMILGLFLKGFLAPF